MADSRVEELRRRIEREPGSRLFAQLAEQLRKEGELEEAIGVARAGLERHPHYPSARLTLGRALLDSGDPAAARAELDAAVQGAPDNILASRLLGEAMETLGDLGAALLQYRRTLEMAPSDRHVEARIQAIQERLGAPAGGDGAVAKESPGPAAAGPSQPRRDLTEPMKAVKREDLPPPPAPEEEEGEALPPTIRIRMPGDPVGGVRAPMPPASAPAPPRDEAAAVGKPPKEETTLPARSRGADDSLPATLPGGRPREAGEPAAPPHGALVTPPAGSGAEAAPDAGSKEPSRPSEDSDLAPTLPSSKAAEYAGIDESLPPTVPPGAGKRGGEVEAAGPKPGATAEAPEPVSEGPADPSEALPGHEPSAVTVAGPPPQAESPAASREAPPPALESAVPSEPPPAPPSDPGPPAEPPQKEWEPPPAPPGAAAPDSSRPEAGAAPDVGHEEAGARGSTEPPVEAAAMPLSSGTLAELYFQQGQLERAVEVYREVLTAEPANEGARARLAEIESAAAAAGTPGPATPAGEGEGRAARRRTVTRTIERLEALLAVVQRR